MRINSGMLERRGMEERDREREGEETRKGTFEKKYELSAGRLGGCSFINKQNSYNSHIKNAATIYFVEKYSYIFVSVNNTCYIV